MVLTRAARSAEGECGVFVRSLQRMYVALLWRGFTSDGFPGGGRWGLEHE